jgi:hypothetical protein
MSVAARAIGNVPPLTARDADWLASEIIDYVIKTLRRDPHHGARSSDEWALVLADLRMRIAELLASHIVGRVDLDEVVATLEAL